MIREKAIQGHSISTLFIVIIDISKGRFLCSVLENRMNPCKKVTLEKFVNVEAVVLLFL